MLSFLTAQEQATLPTEIAKAVNALRKITHDVRAGKATQARQPVVLLQKGSPAMSAWTEIQHLAKARVAQGQSRTLEQGIVAVVQDDPSLAARYRQEKALASPASVGKASAPALMDPPALKALRDIAQRLRAENPKLTPEQAMARAAETPEGRQYREEYRAARRQTARG
ncbi:MAG: hypothetical protein AB7R40_25255 [Nitrospiraceae bacterium]